jgi:hypothetical protein
MFNKEALAAKAFFNLGGMLPNEKWANTTMDYQLEHMALSNDSTLNLAFNGTIFNSNTCI